VVPERGGTPFRQILFFKPERRSGIVYHSRNADTAASSGKTARTVRKLPYTRKFDQLVLRKATEIVATRYRILRLKCTKFDFSWVSAPDHAGGAYTAPQTPSWI